VFRFYKYSHGSSNVKFELPILKACDNKSVATAERFHLKGLLAPVTGLYLKKKSLGHVGQRKFQNLYLGKRNAC